MGKPLTSDSPMLELKGVSKQYGARSCWILKDLNLQLSHGEGVVMHGRSGSGKSTLLNIIGGLEPPTKGAVLFHGEDISRFKEEQLAVFRNRHIGYCFQDAFMQRHLTVLENVILPLLLRGISPSKASQQGMVMLKNLGLQTHAAKLPKTLSGGEAQRAALGRALIGEPELLLADEPTGNLDESTAHDIINLILDYKEQNGAALILITHDIIPFEHNLNHFILAEGALEPLSNKEKGCDT